MDGSNFTFFNTGRIYAALTEDGISPKFIELMMIVIIAGNTASMYFFSSADGIGPRSQVVPREFESIFCISFIDTSWKPTNLDNKRALVGGCRLLTLSNWSRIHVIVLVKKMWKLWAKSFRNSHFGRDELFRRWSSLSLRRKFAFDLLSLRLIARCNIAILLVWSVDFPFASDGSKFSCQFHNAVNSPIGAVSFSLSRCVN